MMNTSRLEQISSQPLSRILQYPKKNPLFVAQVFLQPLLPRSFLFFAGCDCEAICSRTELTKHGERMSKGLGSRERAEPVPEMEPSPTFYCDCFVIGDGDEITDDRQQW
ncbi:hypothetical protein SLA2020_148550 [Shorea laevis]